MLLRGVPDREPPIDALQFNGVGVGEHSMIEHSVFPLGNIVSLATVEQTLDPIFGGPEVVEPLIMERVVGDLATRLQLASFAREVTGSRQRLREVAAVSEIHPLEFFKIPLITKPEYQLRFNVWMPEISANGLEDIHNHKFDFASALVAGRLATYTYDIDAEPPLRFSSEIDAWNARMDPHADQETIAEVERALDWYDRRSSESESRRARIYQVDPTRVDQEVMAVLREGYVRLVQHEVQDAGNVYSLLHTTHHLAFNLDEVTASLFLRGRPIIPRDTIARMYDYRAHRENMNRVSQPKVRPTPKQIKDALTTVVDSMPRPYISFREYIKMVTTVT